MKTTKTLIFLFVLALLSACKSTQNEILPQISVEEGKYNMKIYDSSGKLVLERAGDADFNSYYYSVILHDPEFIKSTTQYDDYFAGLYIQHNGNMSIKSRNEVNQFKKGIFSESDIYANISNFWYFTDGKWIYDLSKGTLQVTEVSQNKMIGKFTFYLNSSKNPSEKIESNKKWGNNIRVEAEFNAKK